MCCEKGQTTIRPNHGRVHLALSIFPTSSCRCHAWHSTGSPEMLLSSYHGLHELYRRRPVHRIKYTEEITVSRCRWLAHIGLPSAQHRVCKPQSAEQGQSIRPTMISRTRSKKRTEPRRSYLLTRIHGFEDLLYCRASASVQYHPAQVYSKRGTLLDVEQEKILRQLATWS